MSKETKSSPFKRALKHYRAAARESGLAPSPAPKQRPCRHRPAADRAPRRYLSVPFDDRFKAKRLGAQWDPAAKRWWIDAAADETPFLAWLYPDPDRSSATREWARPKRNRTKNR